MEKTLTFGIIETYSTFISREPVTIKISDYPELEGKTDEEIKEYIEENWYEMKAHFAFATAAENRNCGNGAPIKCNVMKLSPRNSHHPVLLNSPGLWDLRN